MKWAAYAFLSEANILSRMSDDCYSRYFICKYIFDFVKNWLYSVQVSERPTTYCEKQLWGKTIEFFAVTCVRVCVVIHSYSLIGFGYPRIKKFLFVLQTSAVCAESYLSGKPFGISFTQTCMIYFKNSNISFPIQLHICKISRYCMSQICNWVGIFRDRIGGNTEL